MCFSQRLHQRARAQAPTLVPLDRVCWRLLCLIFNYLVSARSNLAWVIDKPAHFADFDVLFSSLPGVCVDYGRQKSRRDRGNRHLLQTRVMHDSGGSPWRNCLLHRDGIDESSRDLVWAVLACHLVSQGDAWADHVSARPRSLLCYLCDLDLRQTHLDRCVLLRSGVNVTVVKCVKLVFRADHSLKHCLLFKDADFTVVRARTCIQSRNTHLSYEERKGKTYLELLTCCPFSGIHASASD